MRIRVGVVAVVALLVLGGCDWSVVGFGPGRAGSSSAETAITPQNVAGLTEQWKAHLVGPGSDPVVAGSQVYATAQGPYVENTPGSGLYAFDAAGKQGCSGTPRVCTPRWSKFFNSTQAPPPSPDSLSAPAVDSGRIFIGDTTESTSEFSGSVAAFDTAGTPLFDKGDGAVGSPAPSGTLLYSSWNFRCCDGGQYQGIVAQDVQTGDVRFGQLLTNPTPPAVAGNVIYVGSLSTLSAFDARGEQGCSPFPYAPTFFPISCTPLWTGTLSGSADPAATPAVANGLVYQSAEDGQLDVFSAAGCGSSTCAPSWTAHTSAPLHSSPAVTATTAFVAAGSKLDAFAAAGCGASVCQPSWTATMGGAVRAAPSVAGDVVYIGSDDGHVYAFDARGCGHATCPALWSAPTGAGVTTAVAISNGRVFVTDTGGTLHAFSLPPS